jgi:predicted site-specific integrase-resolvase
MRSTELLTADELAGRLRVQPTTVRVWSRQGKIPTVRLSAKVVRFDWDAVLKSLGTETKGAE